MRSGPVTCSIARRCSSESRAPATRRSRSAASSSPLATFADSPAATLDRIEGEGRVAFRYADSVNGSARDIAGVLNDAGNVLGMMPHPERAIDRAHGGTDGLRLFEAALGVLA